MDEDYYQDSMMVILKGFEIELVKIIIFSLLLISQITAFMESFRKLLGSFMHFVFSIFLITIYQVGSHHLLEI